MHPIIYDVAVSIDGYISGPSADISGFAHDGPVVADYTTRLAGYAAAIMGRATYEFGYQYGLEPGQNPYPHMRTDVVSGTLSLPPDSDVSVIQQDCSAVITDLRKSAGGPIYLCGGGIFAGVALRAGWIDQIILKRAPILLGGGTPLFAGSIGQTSLSLTNEQSYGDGYVLQTYDVTQA